MNTGVHATPSSKGAVVKKEHLMYLAVFVAGVVLANKVRTIPGFNKLPTV